MLILLLANMNTPLSSRRRSLAHFSFHRTPPLVLSKKIIPTRAEGSQTQLLDRETNQGLSPEKRG